jgi:hypothetical protein
VTAQIKPSELARLDGYRDGAPKGGTITVLSPSNNQIEIAGQSKIFLDLPDGTHGGRFKSIAVKDGLFSGETADGQTMHVALAEIRAARVTEPNRPAMGLVYVLAAAATTVLLGAGLVFYEMTNRSCPPPYGCSGRALRVGRRVVATSAVDADGWEADLPVEDTAALPDELRSALARLWTESGRGEHASVPAFSRLSLSLVAQGAPASLVEAAHRAALDEIGHARLAFSLATAYAGTPVGPGPLTELQAARAVTATSLAELGAESLIDGCLLEGVGAEVARRALDRARDRGARAALAVIARDEASHAELAWDVVRWCVERGGDPVRRHLAAALEKAPASVSSPAIPEALADALADRGWLGPAVWDDALRATSATVAARFAALTLGVAKAASRPPSAAIPVSQIRS